MADVYVVKMFQKLSGINILNVFFYRKIAGSDPDTAEALHQTFDDDVLASFIDCVSDALSINNLEIFQIDTPTQFFDGQPLNNSGTRTDTVTNRMPTANAFSFKTNRAGAGTRSSYKRFAGLLEEDVGGQALSSAFLALTALDDLQTALGANLTSTSANEYEPVQVKGTWAIGIAPTVNFVIDSVLGATLSTQVSRK